MSAEWQFLVTLNEQLGPLRHPVEIQDVAVRLIGTHLHASRVYYAHLEGDDFIIGRSYANGGTPFAERGAVAHFGAAVVDACRRGETVAVDDVATDQRFTEAEREQLLGGDIGAFVNAPLFKDGRWLATFRVDSARPRVWTRDQIALVEVTADRTWAAAERARAEEALGRNESRQDFLHRLSDTIRPLSDPGRILAETCCLLGTHLRANRVAYGQIVGEDCIVEDDYVDGVPSMAGRFRWTELAGGRGDEILRVGCLITNDVTTDPRTQSNREALKAAGIGAYLCPLLIKDGRWVAAFGIHSRTPRVWTSEEIALANDVADRIWSTLEHRKAEAELRANQEPLAFLLRLNEALRPLSDAAAIQEAAARLLGEYLGVTRVGYAELEGHEYFVRHEHTRGVEPLIGPPLRVTVGDTLLAAFERGETVVVCDVQADGRLGDDDRASLLSRQIAAFIGVALFNDGRMIASFGANHHTPRLWTSRDVELVREVAERTWHAVERTRSEAALRQQKQRLSLALEASAGGSWTWEAGTNQVDWDERFRELYGFTPDEPAAPDKWGRRVHEDDRQRTFALADAVLTSKTQDAWENTFRIVRPDGSLRWIQSRGRADRDADGNVTRITGLDLDFTRHHHAEEALQARRDEEHHRTLRTLLETATQGIVSADARGIVDFANRAAEVMFGWTAEELVGQEIDRLIPLVLSNGANAGGGLDLVSARKDGSTFPIEVTLNYVPTPGGGRTFAFITDITERRRAAAVLQERTTELEHRTTQLTQMAWDLTLAEHHAREEIARTLHDGLQQLLVIVAMNLELQLKQEADDGKVPSVLLTEAKQQLDEAMAAARSLNLELFPPVLQRSGLPAALTWLANWTQDKYKLEVRIAADPLADSARRDVRTLLFESVRELLFNVVKHAQADCVTLELVLRDDDQLCITVTDHGAGFEPARLDDRSQTGQVGWGLFRIRERLTLLGGHFDIDSAPGRGTRVRLIAPRGDEVETAARTLELRSTSSGTSAGGGKAGPPPAALRVLIVDDHPAVRIALRAILHQQPELSVVGDASNGVEAISHAYALRPDVILMDVAMPHMDGVDATARIRAELPDITIFGLSMQARRETAHAIEQAGAAGFFVKGTDTQRLIEHLVELHASRGARQQADA